MVWQMKILRSTCPDSYKCDLHSRLMESQMMQPDCHLFPFSLRGTTYRWLTSLSLGSIKTCEDMVSKFLGRYFPPSKAIKLRQEIFAFSQRGSETLFDAHERFKDLLRKYPHHGFTSWMRIQILYNGLNYQTHHLIDTIVGSSLSNK